MVKVRWKFDCSIVFLEVNVLGKSTYYWFYKAGLHKRFHPRQIFTRPISFTAYKDSLVPHYVGKDGWIEGELEDKIVREKLGITCLTMMDYYEQLAKAC